MLGLDILYTSPFARTIETAQAVLRCFSTPPPLRVTCDLAETLTFAHNNYHNTTIHPKLLEQLAMDGIVYPESDQHVHERCQKFIATLNTAKFANALVISHAGLIQVFTALLCPKLGRCDLGYCDVVCFEQHDDDWIFISSPEVKK